MASRRRATTTAALGLVLALSATTSLVRAAPTAQERETARRLMDEGKERTRSGDLPRALEAYQKAHEIMHVPTTGLALARAHLAVEHLVEARDVALEVARMNREPNEPPVFADARQKAKDLEAALKTRIPTVRIVVQGGPAAHVTLDDAEVGSAILGEPMAVNPGKHVAVARTKDGLERRAEIELAEKDASELVLALPGAATETARAPKPEEKSPGGRSTTASVLIYGGGGLLLAGALTGGVTGGLALSKAGSVKSECENNLCDPAVSDDLDGARTMATISTVGFIVGGVGAVALITGLLLPRSQEHTRTGTAKGETTVWMGLGSAGVRGTF